MQQTHQQCLDRKVKRTPFFLLTQFVLAIGMVGVLVYAGMYMVAMSPLLIRLIGPVLAGE